MLWWLHGLCSRVRSRAPYHVRRMDVRKAGGPHSQVRATLPPAHACGIARARPRVRVPVLCPSGGA